MIKYNSSSFTESYFGETEHISRVKTIGLKNVNFCLGCYKWCQSPTYRCRRIRGWFGLWFGWSFDLFDGVLKCFRIKILKQEEKRSIKYTIWKIKYVKYWGFWYAHHMVSRKTKNKFRIVTNSSECLDENNK